MSFHAVCTTFGWMAVTVGVLSTIAQLRRANSIGTEGISLATWVLFIFLGGYWIAYGVNQRSWIIVMGSLSVLPLQLAVIFRLKPWLRWNVSLRCLGFFLLCCIVPTFFWGWAGGVFGVGLAMAANRLPQLFEVARHRGAMGVSVGAWSISTCGSLFWISYYGGFHLWAACFATCLSGTANITIALLASWRHRQSRQDMIRNVVFST
jgi:uncharacterized protein with PQ loop repeat